jgi:hypothetical protein
MAGLAKSIAIRAKINAPRFLGRAFDTVLVALIFTVFG